MDTRPTSDRVREALFMALEPLEGLRVADLFAGSGALGIEALSRGAAYVDFVDEDPRALAVLRENLHALELEPCSRVWRLSLPRGLGRLDEVLGRANLVLLDPPYGGRRAVEMLEALARRTRLEPGTRVVVEHHARDVIPAACGALARERERGYGQTQVSTYRVGETTPDLHDSSESG
jgi:16S rRNA (guanine(966)-N(2))-methyltransferase RsmD